MVVFLSDLDWRSSTKKVVNSLVNSFSTVTVQTVLYLLISRTSKLGIHINALVL